MNRPEKEEGERLKSNQGEQGFFVFIIEKAVLLITLCIWAVVGLIFWIPILARSIALFSVGTLYAAMFKAKGSAFDRQLDSAIVFYAHGFRRIIEHIGRSKEAEYPEFGFSLGRIMFFLVEIGWSAVFWYALFTFEAFKPELAKLFNFYHSLPNLPGAP